MPYGLPLFSRNDNSYPAYWFKIGLIVISSKIYKPTELKPLWLQPYLGVSPINQILGHNKNAG